MLASTESELEMVSSGAMPMERSGEEDRRRMEWNILRFSFMLGGGERRCQQAEWGVGERKGGAIIVLKLKLSWYMWVSGVGRDLGNTLRRADK